MLGNFIDISNDKSRISFYYIGSDNPQIKVFNDFYEPTFYSKRLQLDYQYYTWKELYELDPLCKIYSIYFPDMTFENFSLQYRMLTLDNNIICKVGNNLQNIINEIGKNYSVIEFIDNFNLIYKSMYKKNAKNIIF